MEGLALVADNKGYGVCLDKMQGVYDKVSVPDNLGWEHIVILTW